MPVKYNEFVEFFDTVRV